MNKKTLSLGALLCTFSLSAAVFAADVGVSVNVSQPGFYGRIDIGRAPQPVVIYPQPVVIEHRGPMVREPIYLRVPPGHERHWDKHCRRYSACGQPVYFVQDRWYRDVYAPRYYREPQRRYEGRDPRRDGRFDHGRHGPRDERRYND